MDALLTCSLCSIRMLPDSVIYSSIPCGCSFHLECIKLKQGALGEAESSHYYVSCYTCKDKPDWRDADRLIARNRALEQVVTMLEGSLGTAFSTSGVTSKKRGSTVLFLDPAPPRPPPASQSTSKQTTSSQRSKLLSVPEPDTGKRTSPLSIEILGEEEEEEGGIDTSVTNANLDVPRADSPLPDSDPEDEDNVLQQLYTASQALAAIPYTEQGVHDAIADSGEVEGNLESIQEEEEDQMLDQMDYIDKRTGMPPASQFRRATVIT